MCLLLLRHLVHCIAILDYGNALYTAGAMVPPITPAEILGFTNYVNAIVSHYQADNSMIIYEVWNEPDIPGASHSLFICLVTSLMERILAESAERFAVLDTAESHLSGCTRS